MTKQQKKKIQERLKILKDIKKSISKSKIIKMKVLFGVE